MEHGDRHLDPDTLAAYVDGRLAVTELGFADRHIDSCDSCRHELSALAAIHTQPRPGGGAAPTDDRLGRYEVLRELGRGAMGLVLRAYDPELARPVAIKLLHHVDAETRDRLRREAQAMARLRHPNVVTVYDVVTDADAMFVAMELVDGTTLRGYCAGRRPREILDACIRAGRGLAAAHDARLVHRDFKPENVLCGEGGEVRVSDFGLARIDETRTELATTPLASTIAGTPAYMAPEIFRGEPATARSDQFSFCVTTYEMLCGKRPYSGDDVRGLRDSVLAGQPAAPDAAMMPPWVWRVLQRGLARDPEARYPSMHELLAALADDPVARHRRRIMVATGAAIAVALGAGTVWITRSHTGPSCAIDEHALAGVWDVDHAEHVRDAIGKVRTADAGRRAVAAVELYARAWVDARRDACEATHVRGDQSQLALDRRVACLDRGRHQLAELVTVLEHADADVADHAIEAIGRLRDPAACTGDAEPGAPAADTALLDRANALEYAGKFADADTIATQVITSGGARIDPRTLAEALIVRARVAVDRDKLADAESLLFDALHAAERGHDDTLVAAAWVEIVLTTGAQEHRFDLAMSNARAADAALARIEAAPDLAIRYDYALGTMLLAQGKLPEARERLEAGRALTGTDRRHRAQAGLFDAALCDTLRQLDKLPEAKERCKQALVALEPTLGPEHQRVAITLNMAGAVAAAQNDLALAEHYYQRAVDIFEKLQRTDQIAYALALSNLGTVYSRRDQLDRAQTFYERARDAFAAHHPTHPQRVLPLQGLGNIAIERNDLPTGIRYMTEARAAIAATYAPDKPALSVAEYNLALAYYRNHQPAEAQALADSILARSLATGHETWMLAARALDMSAMIAEDRHDIPGALALRERGLVALEHANMPDERAYLLEQIGRTHRRLNHVDLAIPPLEEAMHYFDAHPDNAYDVGTARWFLAKALWDSGRDRNRAVDLAQSAADELARAQSGFNLAGLRTEIATWLRTHKKT